MWVNLNSLKVVSFKGRFPVCMRNVFYVTLLDILVIVFWFRFNAIYLGENNGNLSKTKKICFLCQHVSQPFLKMKKFLLNMSKDFLIMSNFYLAEILSEPNSLTIVTSKKNTQNEQLCAHFEYYLSHNENQEFVV